MPARFSGDKPHLYKQGGKWRAQVFANSRGSHDWHAREFANCLNHRYSRKEYEHVHRRFNHTA